MKFLLKISFVIVVIKIYIYIYIFLNNFITLVLGWPFCSVCVTTDATDKKHWSPALRRCWTILSGEATDNLPHFPGKYGWDWVQCNFSRYWRLHNTYCMYFTSFTMPSAWTLVESNLRNNRNRAEIFYMLAMQYEGHQWLTNNGLKF